MPAFHWEAWNQHNWSYHVWEETTCLSTLLFNCFPVVLFAPSLGHLTIKRNVNVSINTNETIISQQYDTPIWVDFFFFLFFFFDQMSSFQLVFFPKHWKILSILYSWWHQNYQKIKNEVPLPQKHLKVGVRRASLE